MPDGIHLTFLGTASVLPEAGGDTASYVVNGNILIDAGWCAALRLLQHHIAPTALDYLLLTHCHHDHYLGLPQVLFYRQMRRAPDAPRGSLKIAGPAEDIERVVTLAKEFLQTERFPAVDPAVELIPLSPGDSLETPTLHIRVCATAHTVPGLCYRLEDRSTDAVLAITGDTSYLPGVVEHVRAADLLVHEASYGPASAPSPDPWGHSGAPDAARVAQEAGVRRLALVHGVIEQRAAAVEAARVIFPNTFWPADGETITVTAG